MSDDWSSFFGGSLCSKDTSSMDSLLQGKRISGKVNRSVLALLEDKDKVTLAVPTGTRVAFSVSPESLLTYKEGFDSSSRGVVVKVRTASYGDTSSFNGRVFVLWEKEGLVPMSPSHLTKQSLNKRASSYRRVVSNLGDLSDFMSPSKKSASELVHKATKDLWSFRKDGDEYVIERLFDANGDPLKV